MKIEEYISSGILEAYLLGEVSDKDRADVEEKLRLHPALQEELHRLEELLERMAFSTVLVPPDTIREKLMSKAKGFAPTKEVKTHRQSMPWMLATAASVTIAMIAGYFAIHYKQQLETTTKELDNLVARSSQIAEQYNQVNQDIDKLESTLDVLDNPSYKKIVMQGTETFPAGLASVYWNNQSEEVYLTVQNLRKLSHEQQYQLWAIVNGKPVDAGVFNTGNRLIKMRSLKGATAFAVTIEPAGGSVSPTLSSIVVIGSV